MQSVKPILQKKKGRQHEREDREQPNWRIGKTTDFSPTSAPSLSSQGVIAMLQG